MSKYRLTLQGFLFPIVPTFVGVIPQGTPFPYIHLNYIQGRFAQPVLQSAILYSNQSSYAEAETIAEQIGEAIGEGGQKLLANDNLHFITIYKGDPFWQHYVPEVSDSILALSFNFEIKSF